MSGLEIIEGIVTVVEVGKAVLERCQTYKDASEDLKKLKGFLAATLFTLDAFEKAIRSKLRTVHSYEDQILPLVEGLQLVFDRLKKQTSRFSTGAELDFVKKIRWTFGGKSGFEAILNEMQQYQNALYGVIVGIKLLFDSNELTLNERQLVKQLYKVGGEGIRHADIMDDIMHGRSTSSQETLVTDIHLSVQATLAKDRDRIITRSEERQTVFVEYRYFEARSGQEIDEVLSDIHKLASVLCSVNAEAMHILRCIGTSDQLDAERTSIVYTIPRAPMPGTEWTLVGALTKSEKPSLDTRIRYALEISEAIMYTHAAGLVHKAICPSNILLLPSKESSKSLSTFLVGFDAARLRDLTAYSTQVAQTDPVRRLYQHPERHLPDIDGKVIRFGIRHDMYSVGVLLLEIGMWRPLAKINDKLEKLTKSFDAQKLQGRLVEAAERLSFHAGQKYASVVLCCLKDTIIHNLEEDTRRLYLEKVVDGLKEIVV